jgi:hypothetical protein
LALGFLVSWPFSLRGASVARIQNDGSQNPPVGYENYEDDKEISEMGISSHASFSVNVGMETLSRILVRSDILHRFSVLFSPIFFELPTADNMAGPVTWAPLDLSILGCQVDYILGTNLF